MNIIETNLKFNSNYSTRSGDPGGSVLHHAAANGSVYDVHNWHLAKGWAGIGYHFYVRKDGTVYRGRPENWVGAHTDGYNSMIGICAEGNFEVEQMPTAQKNAIIELLKYLQRKYGEHKIYGHRDLDATACPGKNYPFDEIVDAVRAAEPEQTDTLYRVQVGAFREKANAEKLLKDLKEDGYDGIITGTAAEEKAEDNWWDDIKYFKRSEFECHCGGKYCNGYPAEPAKVLVHVADRVRKHFGAPAIVSSGVRCKTHNANVGGVSNSRHMSGKAMDFCVVGKSATQVLAYVEKQPEINYAYAIDSEFVHMDIL